MKIIIPEIGPSSNSFYAGMHSAKRSKLANRWHAQVVACVKKQRVGKWQGEYPVRIEVECRFGKSKRGYDADNTSVTAKMSIDGLVHAGVIVDDSPRYVRTVSLSSVKTSDPASITIVTLMEA